MDRTYIFRIGQLVKRKVELPATQQLWERGRVVDTTGYSVFIQWSSELRPAEVHNSDYHTIYLATY